MEQNNLDLWRKVSETDPNHTKEVTYGRKFTTINAQYQLMKATEQFGPYGLGFGIKSIEYHMVPTVHDQVMLIGNAVFFAQLNSTDRTEFPVSSSIFFVELINKTVSNVKVKELVADDEAYKKIETDITTKALSKLGFNADVFLGRYDDNKYVNSLKKKYAEETGAEETPDNKDKGQPKSKKPTGTTPPAADQAKNSPPVDTPATPPKPAEKETLVEDSEKWTRAIVYMKGPEADIEKVKKWYNVSPELIEKLLFYKLPKLEPDTENWEIAKTLMLTENGSIMDVRNRFRTDSDTEQQLLEEVMDGTGNIEIPSK